MITFSELNSAEPYSIFYKYFKSAHEKGQQHLDAIAISSLNRKLMQVNSRFVNLKYIIDDEWVFFSNYDSPKSIDFKTHDQISALIFWNTINTQIRIKANIFKSTKEISDNHFKGRSKEKNALAISSKQSRSISSYEEIKKNYHDVLEKKDLFARPEYWGGFSFTPYEIEFWVGNSFRLNKRDLFVRRDDTWEHSILEP